MKNIFILLTVTLLISCAKKNNADIDKVVSEAYPNVKIDSIKKLMIIFMRF